MIYVGRRSERAILAPKESELQQQQQQQHRAAALQLK